MEKKQIISVLAEASQYLGGIDAKCTVDLSYRIDLAMMAIKRSGTVIGRDVEFADGGPYVAVEWE